MPYQLYLAAACRAGCCADSLDKAIELLHQALNIDPSYAIAWTELAWVHQAEIVGAADAVPSGSSRRQTALATGDSPRPPIWPKRAPAGVSPVLVRLRLGRCRTRVPASHWQLTQRDRPAMGPPRRYCSTRISSPKASLRWRARNSINVAGAQYPGGELSSRCQASRPVVARSAQARFARARFSAGAQRARSLLLADQRFTDGWLRVDAGAPSRRWADGGTRREAISGVAGSGHGRSYRTSARWCMPPWANRPALRRWSVPSWSTVQLRPARRMTRSTPWTAPTRDR